MESTVTTHPRLCVVDRRAAAAGVQAELKALQLSVATHLFIWVDIVEITSLVDGCSAAGGVHAELSVPQLSVTTDLLVVIVDFSGTAGCVVAIHFRPDDGVIASAIVTADIGVSIVDSPTAAVR